MNLEPYTQRGHSVALSAVFLSRLPLTLGNMTLTPNNTEYVHVIYSIGLSLTLGNMTLTPNMYMS